MVKRYVINPSFSQKTYNYCDCIVIGSGIAGLSTAIRISKNTKVKVLTKSALSESTTWYAQGGIAAAIKKPDRWKNHYEDTIKAGQGLCDSKAVRILVKYAPKMIEELIEQGITFDISGGEISLTTEGGHSYPRILHAGGDATGEEIEKKLVRFSKGLNQIEFFPEYLALDILTSNDRCLGVLAMDLKSKVIEIHPSANIIIASGGIGQLFNLTTNPSISTGDGIAMAYRAGASIKDIEFMQFHPTVFKTNNSGLFLITEALRGEGAYLRDDEGNRFMVGKHPRAELAPRDIVVKEMIKVMKEKKIKFVYLDATHLPESMLKIRFPNIIAKLKENGLDLSKDLIKVFPAAHYLNGGIKTNFNGLTDVQGLYACGEAAATGAHGANRLASNSLIEGLVYGWQIYKDITGKLKNKKVEDEGKIIDRIGRLVKSETSYKSDMEKARLEAITKYNSGDRINDDDNNNRVNNDGKADNYNNDHYMGHDIDKINNEIDKITKKFRHMMSEKVGILRDRDSLDEAKKFIDTEISNNMLYDNIDKRIVELVNMLTVGGLIVKAASMREESRGTHQRNDFPKRDDKNWGKHIILKEGKVHFEPVQ